MLTLTPSAVEAVDALLHQPEVPDNAGLRIAAAGEARLSVGLVEAPAPEDQVIEEGGARVFVDPGAAMMLDQAQLEAEARGDEIAFGLSRREGADNGAGPPAA